METPEERKTRLILEDKLREREELNILCGPDFDIYEQLEQVFPKFNSLKELPEKIDTYKLFPVSYLSRVISPDISKKTQKAISYLYPKAEKSISLLERHSYPPTFALTSSLFRYWAVLSSDRLKKVIHALASMDISEIIKEQESRSSYSHRSRSVFAAFEILSCLRILKATKNDIKHLSLSKIATILTPDDIADIAESKKPFSKPIASEAIGYDPLIEIRNFYEHKMILCIDPHNKVDDILNNVREIVEKFHKELSDSYELQKEVPRGITYTNSVKHSLRAFYEMDFSLPHKNNKLFKEINPLQYFQLKEKGDKSRDEQTVLDENFHAMITYELRKRDIRPVDVEKKYFCLNAAPNTKEYKAQTKAHNDRNKRAERLIERALACAPIQS